MVANREASTDLVLIDELRIATLRDLENTGTTPVTVNAKLSFGSGKDLQFDTTSGSKIGTTDTQKIGFWNATPVVQQVLATGTGKTVDNVITLLQTLGLCKQA